MLRYSPCEAENKELEIGGGGTGKDSPIVYPCHAAKRSKHRDVQACFQAGESRYLQGIRARCGCDAGSGSQVLERPFFKNRISRPSRKENLLYGKIGDEAQEEDGRERANGNAGEGPKITKKTRRSTVGGMRVFE
jgi:hypothetical protein